MDALTLARRSWNMSRIRGRDTKPEMAVRQTLFNHGFRYRLHDKDLPGRPDIVLKRWRTVVFVHGCFWHRHPQCNDATLPKSNRDFWLKKLTLNAERDQRHKAALTKAGWRVITIWECETVAPSKISRKLAPLLLAKEQTKGRAEKM